MKRGISLFLIILLLNQIVFAINLETNENQNEKDLIESCKFQSSGPEVVLQKTQYGEVLIWLYEPDKEKFGDLTAIKPTKIEKTGENKYSFKTDESNQVYTVEAIIPDSCIRFKTDKGEARESAQDLCAPVSEGPLGSLIANVPLIFYGDRVRNGVVISTYTGSAIEEIPLKGTGEDMGFPIGSFDYIYPSDSDIAPQRNIRLNEIASRYGLNVKCKGYKFSVEGRESNSENPKITTHQSDKWLIVRGGENPCVLMYTYTSDYYNLDYLNQQVKDCSVETGQWSSSPTDTTSDNTGITTTNPTPTDTGTSNEGTSSNIDAQNQQALGDIIGKSLYLFFDLLFKLLKAIWDVIVNFFKSTVEFIFPPQNIECSGRSLGDIIDQSIFTKESVTITNKSKASVSFEYDKCNDDKIKVEEIYCKKKIGNSAEEVRAYKELPCSEGCNVDGGVCIHPPIELGDIKISGGIDNRAFSWVPFVGKLARARGSGSINAKISLDKQKKCGYPEFSSNVKLWFHKDLYDKRYKGLIKEQKNDLFSMKEKEVLFPPNDGSYVVFINGGLKEGKLTLKIKYKRAKEDPPSDLNNFDMSGAKENSFTKNLDDPEILKRFIEIGLVKDSRELTFLKLKDAITAILKLYAGFSGMGLTIAQGIVMVKSGDPTYEGSMLPSDVTKKIIELNNDNFDQEFESKIVPIIMENIKKKEYLEEIEKYCGN